MCANMLGPAAYCLFFPLYPLITGNVCHVHNEIKALVTSFFYLTDYLFCRRDEIKLIYASVIAAVKGGYKKAHSSQFYSVAYFRLDSQLVHSSIFLLLQSSLDII
jgi:hypothetical protein